MLHAFLLVGLWLSASPTKVAATRVDLGTIYLKRPELQLPAVKTALGSTGLEVMTQAEAADSMSELFSCTGPQQKCVRPLIDALVAANAQVSAVIRSKVSREPADSFGVLVQAYSVPDGRLLTTFYEGGVEGEAGLVRVLTAGASQVGRELASLNPQTEKPLATVYSSRTEPLMRKIGWGVLAASVATGIFGLVSVIRRITILNEPLAPDAGIYARDRSVVYNSAEEQRITAVGMFIISGATAVVAAITLGLGFHQTPISFDLIPNAGGASLSVGGVF